MGNDCVSALHLEISMNDVHLMAVLDTLQDLLHTVAEVKNNTDVRIKAHC